MEGNKTQDYGGIGWAVNHARHGHKVRRRGWNAKNLWVSFVPAGSVQVPQKFGDGKNVQPFLVMRTAEDTLVPWLCSQTDLLAADWELVEPVLPGEYHHPSDAAQTQKQTSG